MKKRYILLISLLSISVGGCKKPDIKVVDALQATPYVDDYKEAISKQKIQITGEVELESGDYVVYSNEGAQCVIQGEGKCELFSKREYIHVDNDINVIIENGYLVPLEEAAALNGEIENEGVFLVGFDILPNDKQATDAYMEVTDDIPVLFEKPKSISYQNWDRVKLKDRMVVRLDNSYAVTRQMWDAENAAAEWLENWEDTSIDYKRGYTKEMPETEVPVLSGSQDKKPDDIPTYSMPIEATRYYLLEDYEHERIDMWEEDDETLYRAYYHRIWFQSDMDYTFTTTAKNMWNMKAPEINEKGKLSWEKLKKEAYAETEYTKHTVAEELSDMYLIGYDIQEGLYKVEAGKVKFMYGIPTFKEFSNMVTIVDSLPSYTTDAEIVLKPGDLIVCDKLKIKKIRDLTEEDY